MVWGFIYNIGNIEIIRKIICPHPSPPVVASVGAVIAVVVTYALAYFRRIWCFKDRTLAPKIIQLGGSKVLLRRGVHSRPVIGFAPTQNSPRVVFEGGQPDRRESGTGQA